MEEKTKTLDTYEAVSIDTEKIGASLKAEIIGLHSKKR